MCGIAGIVRFDDQPIATDRLDAMRRHLLHRGPDGDGVRLFERCGLVHTRLSIIDLLSGHQPMTVAATAEHETLALVFNGEIYNHRALRQKLEALGHRFASDHSDTEVLLHGYRAWGTEMPKHLHGMFAFAIWDSDAHELFLCRDRAGKKPLYVRRSGRELAFASLVATFRAAGLPCEIDRSALLRYLRIGYTGQASILAGVEEIPAAHWMKVAADGTTDMQRYWRPPPVSRTSTSLGAVKAVEEVLVEAVHKRLEADVPLGCFLSGGLDSSLVAAIAQTEYRRRGLGDLQVFCAGMPDLRYDESEHAQSVAKHIGARFTQLVADETKDVIGDLHRLTAVSGEPFADSSILPAHWLSRITRSHVSVALSGDGGDELFGGYTRYRGMAMLERNRWWLSKLPQRLPGDANARRSAALLARLTQAARFASPMQQYFSMIHLFNDAMLGELGIDVGDTSPLEDWPDEPKAAHAAMRWDLNNYLPFDLLRKIDRASMSIALEVRCPMLDTQVCDLAGHLPLSVLMPGGKTKGVLRQVAMKYLPASIVNRPKRGFALPIGEWFRHHLRQPLCDHIFDGTMEAIGLNRRWIERMFDEHDQQQRDHAHRLFALLSLSVWWKWLHGTEG